MADQDNRPQRFSDDELRQFHADFQELAQRFELHEQEEQSKYDQLLQMQAANAEAINQLTEATRDMVDAWRAAEGAVKVGAWLGRLVKWLSGLAVIGGAFAWLLHHGPK